MSTIYCRFCPRPSVVSKYKRSMCEACHMAFVAGRKYGRDETQHDVEDRLGATEAEIYELIQQRRKEAR